MKLFAASGSCFSPIKQVKGMVNELTFTSDEFTGTMDSQKFWDDLAEFARNNEAFIELVY